MTSHYAAACASCNKATPYARASSYQGRAAPVGPWRLDCPHCGASTDVGAFKVIDLPETSYLELATFQLHIRRLPIRHQSAEGPAICLSTLPSNG